MDKDLTNYFKKYNLLDKTTCQEIVKELNGRSDTFKTHNYYNSITRELTPINGDKELDTSYFVSTHDDYISSQIREAYKKYIIELNFPWFSGWNRFSFIKYNRYNVNTIMSEHCDHIHSLFDGDEKGVPILTSLVILNDEFTGGELVFWRDQVINVDVGDILVFPSNFLYPHKVQPILSGVRYSCVTWAW